MTHPKNIVSGSGIKPDENPSGGEASDYLVERAERQASTTAVCETCGEERTGDLSKFYGTVRWECRECGSCLPLGTY